MALMMLLLVSLAAWLAPCQPYQRRIALGADELALGVKIETEAAGGAA